MSEAPEINDWFDLREAVMRILEVGMEDVAITVPVAVVHEARKVIDAALAWQEWHTTVPFDAPTTKVACALDAACSALFGGKP